MITRVVLVRVETAVVEPFIAGERAPLAPMDNSAEFAHSHIDRRLMYPLISRPNLPRNKRIKKGGVFF